MGLLLPIQEEASTETKLGVRSASPDPDVAQVLVSSLEGSLSRN